MPVNLGMICGCLSDSARKLERQASACAAEMRASIAATIFYMVFTNFYIPPIGVDRRQMSRIRKLGGMQAILSFLTVQGQEKPSLHDRNTDRYPLPPLKRSFSTRKFEQAAREAGFDPFPCPAANTSQPYKNPLDMQMGQCRRRKRTA
jgi:hypothetical protein